jgi:hypothetical protein
MSISYRNFEVFMKVSLICTLILASAFLVATQILTIFVVQPIGALPEGKTLIMSRMKTMNFIDSADTWCSRNTGKVNLICRAIVLGKVGESGSILIRLLYSKTLYLWSTNGAEYTN